jgi:pimeloyl-ACP methyl ester carboxylesterase
VLAGRHDPLRKPGYWEDFVPLMPNAELHVFERAAHMGQIECAEEFNARVLGFLGE